MSILARRSMARGMVAVSITSILLAGSARGQAPFDPVEAGIRATALIEVTGLGPLKFGSGFCLSRTGLFVTNAHVVEGWDRGAEVHLFLESGRPGERKVLATVIRFDRTLDLALLKIEPDPRLARLALGREDSLRHTASIVTFGFPLGRLTAAGKDTSPDVTALTSRITSLPKEGGRIRYIQFDNQLNPGNSGGPVIDESGRVVGVAVMTVKGAAMNREIPVGLLAGFLAPPVLIFDPPRPDYPDRWRPITWPVKVVSADPAAPPAQDLSVSVTIRPPNGSPRVFAAVPAGGGLFKATFTPVPREPSREL